MWLIIIYVCEKYKQTTNKQQYICQQSKIIWNCLFIIRP
jgi:hypothetical protein